MKIVDKREIRTLVRQKGPAAWAELVQRHGMTFRSAGLVVTCEPDAVRCLLMEKVHTETRSALHRILRFVPGANGILFLDGEPWLKRIKAVMPAFHRTHVDSFAASLRILTLNYAASWHERGNSPDLYAAVQELGAASVLKMGYGLDPAEPLARQLGRALISYKQTSTQSNPHRRIDEFGVGPTRLISILPTMLHLRSRQRDVATIVRRLLSAAERDRHEDGWLAQLARSGLPESEIAEEITHLYGAFNAIDYVMAAALYELGRDPQLLDSLRRELTAAIEERHIVVREDLPLLPLLNGFMLEILRLYPVSMGIARKTGAPMLLGGESLPAGTEVLINLFALHHHPDFWDQPHELKPSRWQDSVEPKVPFSYIPFLDGFRKCIGRSMAEMQMLIILTTLLQRYRWRVLANADIQPFMVPRFANALPFTIEPIE